MTNKNILKKIENREVIKNYKEFKKGFNLKNKLEFINFLKRNGELIGFYSNKFELWQFNKDFNYMVVKLNSKKNKFICAYKQYNKLMLKC